MIHRTSIVFFTVLATLGIAACNGATADNDPPASSSSDVVGAGSSSGSSGSGSTGGKCCDPAAEPPPGIEGVWCCGDGTWQYDIGVGNQTASCKQFGGNGKICNPPPKPKPPTPTCCDPATKPPPGIEGTWCCADGTWAYDIGSGNQKASCGTHGSPGAVCNGGEACGPPPPVALCANCNNGRDIETMFKWIDGKPTCECCAPAK